MRGCFGRPWPLVVEGVALADAAVVRDNGPSRRPFRVIATVERGSLVCTPAWPPWAPPPVLGDGAPGDVAD